MPEPNQPIELDEIMLRVPWLERLAYDLVRDSSLADDLVQQTLIAVWTNPPNQGAFYAWARVVMRRFLMASKSRRVRQGELRAGKAREQELTHEPSADELLEREELRSEVVNELAQLPDPYRDVLSYRYLRGLGIDQVAEQLGVPRETVRTRLRRAKEALLERLSRSGGRQRWLPALLPLALDWEELGGLEPVLPRPAGRSFPRLMEPAAALVAVSAAVLLGGAITAGAVLWASDAADDPAASIASHADAPSPLAPSRSGSRGSDARAGDREPGGEEGTPADAGVPDLDPARRVALRVTVRDADGELVRDAGVRVVAVTDAGLRGRAPHHHASGLAGDPDGVDIAALVAPDSGTRWLLVQARDAVHGLVSERILVPSGQDGETDLPAVELQFPPRVLLPVDLDLAGLAAPAELRVAVAERTEWSLAHDRETYAPKTPGAFEVLAPVSPGADVVLVGTAPGYAPALALLRQVGPEDRAKLTFVRGHDVTMRLASPPVASPPGWRVQISPVDSSRRTLTVNGLGVLISETDVLSICEMRFDAPGRSDLAVRGLEPTVHQVHYFVDGATSDLRRSLAALEFLPGTDRSVELFFEAASATVRLRGAGETLVLPAVAVAPAGPDAAPARPVHLRRAETTFFCRPGTDYVVIAEADGYARTEVEFTSGALWDETIVDVQLEAAQPSGGLRLDLRGPDGRAIDRASVVLRGRPIGSTLEVIREVAARPEGPGLVVPAAAFEEFGPGPMDVVVCVGGDRRSTMREYQDVDATITLPLGSGQVITRTVERGGWLSVDVRDNGGARVSANVEVWRDGVRRQGRFAWPNALGFVVVSTRTGLVAPSVFVGVLEPGRHELRVKLDGELVATSVAEVTVGECEEVEITLPPR